MVGIFCSPLTMGKMFKWLLKVTQSLAQFSICSVGLLCWFCYASPKWSKIHYCRLKTSLLSNFGTVSSVFLTPADQRRPKHWVWATKIKHSTNINSVEHRQTECLLRTFLLRWSLNLWPGSLETSPGCRCSRRLRWQTAGRRWHALLAKYSTSRSNSADRKNIDTVIQGRLTLQWDAEGKKFSRQ